MTSPKTLLTAWRVPAKKQFGQNFLINSNTAEAIVRRADIEKSDAVLEIGPGLGALTIPIARSAKTVLAVEKDPRLADLLRTELLSSGLDNVLVHRGDILDLNFGEISGRLGQPPIVIGNLPYNISSQILIRILKNRQYIARAVLMFQKELANRLKSPPGNRDYGRITVMLNYCTILQPLMELKADQFFPKPKIDSTVLDIRFLNPLPHPVKNESFFFAVIKAAFGKRRKTLRNALSQSELLIDTKTALSAITAAEIDPNRRAETLSVDEFARLADHLILYVPQEQLSETDIQDLNKKSS